MIPPRDAERPIKPVLRDFKATRQKAAARKAKRSLRAQANADLNAVLSASGAGRALAKAVGLKLKKPKRKKSPTLSKLKKLLWAEMSLLVRSWSAVCLACGIRPTECAAHIVPSNEGAATRFFLPNLYPCCIICNGLEKWNRASWVYHHREMFGAEVVDALYAYSDTMFQLKKDWVLEQTERMRKIRAMSEKCAPISDTLGPYAHPTDPESVILYAHPDSIAAKIGRANA